MIENKNTRKIIKFIFIMKAIFLLLLVHDFALATSQQILTYYLEIDEENWDSFNINITLENNKFEQLLCIIPDWIPGIYSRNHFHDDVTDFKVLGEMDQDIEVTHINPNSWLISPKNNNVIIISYKINRKRDVILGECINKDFAWINSGTVFMFIRELKDVPIRLDIRVPHGWKLATGLNQTHEDFEYSAQNYQELVENPIFMGTFEDYYFMIKRETGFVIIDGPQDANIGKLVIMAPKIATYQLNLFNMKYFNPYYFICKILPQQRTITSQAFPNTSIFYLSRQLVNSDLKTVGKVLASNFFQRWLGYQILNCDWSGDYYFHEPRTNLLWFTHGVSDYYGSLTMVRTQLWKEEDFVNHYIDLFNALLRHAHYLSPSVSKLSYTISEQNYQETLDFLRLKGQVLCLLLDLKIRDITDNKKSLDDVVAFIKHWFVDRGKKCAESDLLTVVNSVSHENLTSFFDKYVNGNVELPFSDYLQTVGVFLETKIDSIPDLGKVVLSNDTNEIIELEKGCVLENAGMKVGDRFLTIDNQHFTGNNQLNQLIHSLQIGKDVELEIKRNGLSLLLVAKVTAKEVEIVQLKDMAPQTDRQTVIRKAWLSVSPQAEKK